MYSLRVAKRVIKELQPYPPKVFKQVASKIFALSINPMPHDSKKVARAIGWTPESIASFTRLTIRSS